MVVAEFRLLQTHMVNIRPFIPTITLWLLLLLVVVRLPSELVHS